MIQAENTKNESQREVFTGNFSQPDKVLSLEIIIDKENIRIYVRHSIDKQIWSELKAIPKAWWQKEKKQWTFAGNNQNYLAIKQIAIKNNCVIKKEYRKTIDEKETNPVVKRYIETMQMKKNSINTMEAYLPHFKKFVGYFKDIDIESLGHKEIAQYIEKALKHTEGDTIRLHLICAVKYYYEHILGRDRMIFKLRQTK
jgi:integrase/recombinase XerD